MYFDPQSPHLWTFIIKLKGKSCKNKWKYIYSSLVQSGNRNRSEFQSLGMVSGLPEHPCCVSPVPVYAQIHSLSFPCYNLYCKGENSKVHFPAPSPNGFQGSFAALTSPSPLVTSQCESTSVLFILFCFVKFWLILLHSEKPIITRSKGSNCSQIHSYWNWFKFGSLHFSH